MRIITVNLPPEFLDRMKSLTGEAGIYPSRSELIRVAVREYLIKENQSLRDFTFLAKGLNHPKIHSGSEKHIIGSVYDKKDIPIEFTQ